MVGSHCGVSIGEDGPSQMALEDIAMFRSLPGCTLFYPSDAVACEMATQLAANTRGVINRSVDVIKYFMGKNICILAGKTFTSCGRGKENAMRG